MGEEEKVVARFKNGGLVKGYVRNLRIESDSLRLREPKARTVRRVLVDDLKAVYFVKTFKGYGDYVERKAFGIRKSAGCKVYVKFSDREALLGYIDGDIPWDKGFSLTKLGNKAKGFFLIPVDSESNNNRVFVVGSSIKDITIMVA